MKPETKQLLSALLADARSAEPARHHNARQQLETPSVLDALDSAEDYANAGRFRLRVAQVTLALARNPSPTAAMAFLALTTSETFLAHDERIFSLIRTSAPIRPAPPPLADFWDRHCQAGDCFSPTTIGVLLDNGSPAAIALFERKLGDPSHDDDSKAGWLRSDVLEHRNDLLLLEACERLLAGPLSPPTQVALVEVLFDYRPAEWFPPSASHSAPPLTAATPESLDQLVKVGVVALTMVELSDEQRQIVKARIEEAATLRAP
jgi:hypothetical protein